MQFPPDCFSRQKKRRHKLESARCAFNLRGPGPPFVKGLSPEPSHVLVPTTSIRAPDGKSSAHGDGEGWHPCTHPHALNGADDNALPRSRAAPEPVSGAINSTLRTN